MSRTQFRSQRMSKNGRDHNGQVYVESEKEKEVL
jgi:hypothetical protein